jgi:hypothetical protein
MQYNIDFCTFIFNELLTQNVEASIVSDLSQSEHLKIYGIDWTLVGLQRTKSQYF